MILSRVRLDLDLSTMELKLDSNLYPTLEVFLKDAGLIFSNCRRFNPETSTYVKNANKLERYMKERGPSIIFSSFSGRLLVVKTQLLLLILLAVTAWTG